MLAQGIQNYYRTDIHSPIVHPKDALFGGPFYELNSEIPLVFEFDIFNEIESELIYSIEHCDHQFRPDDLDEMDFIQGFSENRIPYPNNSLNTLQAYDHYVFELPNEMTQFRISGNYRVTVYNNDEKTSDDVPTPLAICYFTVYENKSSILAQISASSYPGLRFQKQEVDLKIMADLLPATDRDKIKVTIVQNQDFLHALYTLTPAHTPSFSEFHYDYSDGRNPFWGGGEYRMFEFKNPKGPCFGVERINAQHVYLQTEISENTKSYATRKDINGNYFITTQNQEISFDDQLNADYYTVHFSLQAFPENKNIYLECAGISNRYTPAEWNSEKELYEASAYLKQGVYSYRFVEKTNEGSFIPFSEGNHYEAENDYTILLYGFNRNWGVYGCYGMKKINSAAN
jgi:hypothetical protein